MEYLYWPGTTLTPSAWLGHEEQAQGGEAQQGTAHCSNLAPHWDGSFVLSSAMQKAFLLNLNEPFER